jgi:2-keto-3-deoxy-L-rhamnonate aldolase RhmA
MDVSTYSGFRARLHTPGAVSAAMMIIPDPVVATILGFSGFDCVMLDAEHGQYTLSSMQACVEALKATPASIVVRTASAQKPDIQHYLDVGVDGILVPHVETASETKNVVEAARYPPEGTRGIGAVRSNRYGLDFGVPLEDVNARVAVLVIIESRRGIENANEIASVPGLDGIIVGVTDLAADLGVRGQPDQPEFLAGLEAVVRSGIANSLKVGTPGQAIVPQDSSLNLCCTDVGELARGARAALEQVRSEVYDSR